MLGTIVAFVLLGLAIGASSLWGQARQAATIAAGADQLPATCVPGSWYRVIDADAVTDCSEGCVPGDPEGGGTQVIFVRCVDSSPDYYVNVLGNAGHVCASPNMLIGGGTCDDPILESELASLADLNTQLGTSIADGAHTAADLITEGDSNVEVIDAGTGQVDIDLDAALAARFVATASAANYVTFTQGASGNPFVIAADGEANVDLYVDSKGTGDVRIRSAADSGLLVEEAGTRSLLGNSSWKLAETAPSATTPVFQPKADAFDGIGWVSAGSMSFIAQNISVAQTRTSASGVNYLTFAAGTTGNGAVLGVDGEANADLVLQGKGSGEVDLSAGVILDISALDTSGGTDKYVLQQTGAATYEWDWPRFRSHATDCTSLTDGEEGDSCWEIDANTIYVCEPSAGLCDTAGEWAAATAAGDGVGYDTIEDNDVAETQRGILNILSGTDISATCADDAGNTETDCTFALDLSGITNSRMLYDSGSGLAGASQLTHDGTNLTLDLVAGDSAESTLVVEEVYNNSGASLPTCAAVYISGFNVGADLPEVSVADSDGSGTMPALGLVQSTISNAASGFVIVGGVLASLDTSTAEGWTVGAPVYVNSTGTATTVDCGDSLTETKPTGSTELIQAVARVVRVNASNGALVVQGAGRSNDVPNALTVGTDDTINTDSVTLDNTWALAQLESGVVGDTENPNASGDIGGDFATGLTYDANSVNEDELAATITFASGDNLVLPIEAADQTTDGEIDYDSTEEVIEVGDDGVATLKFYPAPHFSPTAGISTDHGAGAITATTDLAAGLCGTNQILEDQGASWACIATPSGAFSSFDITDTDATPILTVDDAEQIQFIGAGTVTVTAAADASNHDVTITGSAHSTECSTGSCSLNSATTHNGNSIGIAGSCTNQFVRTVNSAAAPTCATVVDTDAEASFVHTDEASTWASAGTQLFNDPVQIYPDGSNGVQVTGAGALSATGTGTITATEVACTGCVAAAEIETAPAISGANIDSFAESKEKTLFDSGNLTATDDIPDLWIFEKAVTVTSARCISSGGTSITVTVEDDAGNDLTTSCVCGTTLTNCTLTANDSFTQWERADWTTVSVSGSVTSATMILAYDAD